VKTKVEELPESKVRLEVEVSEHDIQHALEHAANDLAASVRIPGFRKGKVPMQVLMARVGREALWQEAVGGHIEGWFWHAAADAGIRPVEQPELSYELPEEGTEFSFTATVAVAPKPEIADWTTLEVPATEPEVPSELLDLELDRVRETIAELVPVEGRPVQAGDSVIVDLEGEEMGTERDYMVEVGSGRLVEEIEDALVGMSAGQSSTVTFELADDRTASVDVTVKEIKEKVLPPLDDELARAASEFQTLAELRGDVEERLREQITAELEAVFRENAADALVDASTIEGVEPLVEQRTAELVNGLVRTLERRGVSVEVYLTMTGQTQDEVIDRLRAEAERSVKRELVLEAVAEREGVEATDTEVEEIVREQAGAAGEDADEALRNLREHGGFEQLRSDLRLKKALDLIVAGVKRIPVELAAAREKLWTPEKERGGSGMKIWTPGSEEAR
jgi:trigger factor